MARISIVIPVWHHPVLVDEAVLSCIGQSGDNYHIILINDGCDLEQTRMALEGWLARYPGKITLLTQPNQGLSAARNTGIDHALKDPSCEAVFFLDADNVLDPHAVALFEKLLDREPEAGWFYPQVDMFGMEVNYSNGQSWALSRLASINCSDAGSLVRRAVFERGLRFDTDFRIGFEDWDFWLGAVRLGFIGSPVNESFFRYRKRPESMVASANRKDVLLRGQLREKHKWLYGSARLPEAWGREYPRFAIIDSEGKPAIGSNPAAPQPLLMDEFIAEFYNQRANPAESRFPPMLVFCRAGVVEDLARAKILDSCFYQLEGALRFAPVAAIHLHQGPLSIRANGTVRDSDGDLLMQADIIAISMHHVNAALDKEEMGEIVRYLIENVSVFTLDVHMDAPTEKQAPALDPLMETLGALMISPLAAIPAAQFANWRSPVFAPIARDVADCNAGGRPALVPTSGAPQVGFVIPVFRFGGVEKCLVALARALVKKGVECHLFIYGFDPVQAAGWMLEPFSKIWILKNSALREWSGSRYMGTADAEHPGKVLMGDMLGPLTQMDVVVNCGAGVINAELSALRERGIKLCAWEHVLDSTAYGRTRGTPFITLGYESVFDRIITCSEQLSTRMAALGVPRHKLLALPNGPGYEAASQPERRAAARLRVGFLGRFDPQKGVDRYIEIATALGAEMSFIAAGGAVMGASIAFPDTLVPQAPILTREGLDDFYASIDILVLPSRDEGLPLTILEAQRAGVVVIASDVGAVREAVSNGETGFLLDPARVVPEAIALLARLDKDRALLKSLAENARGKPDRWAQNAARFIESLL